MSFNTEQWFENLIAAGLQGLLVLRLPGAPAEDSIDLTMDIWLVALSSNSWDELRDSDRIMRAFRSLYRECERWPVPKLFLASLPKIETELELHAPLISEEQRKKINKELLIF